MKQALEQAYTLNEAIRRSKEYENYVEAAYRLRQHPELFAKYNEFRRRNHELQFRESEGNLYEDGFQLMKEYDTILQDSYVNDFVLAEQKFCLSMQEIYETIAKDLELSYEFLEE